VAEIYRKLGVSEQTFYPCRKKYAGGAELRRIRQLEEENRRWSAPPFGLDAFWGPKWDSKGGRPLGHEPSSKTKGSTLVSTRHRPGNSHCTPTASRNSARAPPEWIIEGA
jgi:hypothetical protein